MVVANAQNYALMDILASSQFYENIITARNITRDSNCESSFCVWGDARKYTLTAPRKEKKRFCEAWEEKADELHHPRGFGLYTPKHKSRLLDVHYHPPDNSAITSKRDLENQLEVLTKNFELHPYSKFYNLVSVVAHYSPINNVIRLFFGQYNTSEIFPVMNVPLSLNRLLRKQCGGSGRGYDCSDQRLPYKVADVLTATGKYRAEVISFRKRSEYDSGLRKLEGWGF